MTVLLVVSGPGVATVIDDALDDWIWIRGDRAGTSIRVSSRVNRIDVDVLL